MAVVVILVNSPGLSAGSSSMVAVHFANLGVQAKDCEWTFTAGVNQMLVPGSYASICSLGALAPDARTPVRVGTATRTPIATYV